MTAHQQPNTGTAASGDDQHPDIAQIQANIEQTREDLGETVDALTAKLDVKTRTRARLVDAKDQAAATVHQVQEKTTQLGRSAHHAATDDQGTPTPAATAAAATLAVALLAVTALAAWTRRRHTMPFPGRGARR